MNYIYNQKNLLDNSEKYMYTKFQGANLFQSYFSNRNNVLEKCRVNIPKSYYPSLTVQRAFKVIEEFLLCKYPEEIESYSSIFKQENIKDFNFQLNDNHDLNKIDELMIKFSIEERIKTSLLLETLFASIILDENYINNKIWLDRLVQRFEVTKKLYEEYLPGFRKGNGRNNLIKLYWLFAIVLSIFYAGTNKIKYLSTIIKVCDLITSLPFKDLSRDIPEYGLYLVLSTETLFVRILLKAKGIEYDF